MRRFIAGAAALVAAFVVSTQPAAACAGLIGPNGAVNLLRTTTFAGYHDGIEHYVTAFKFQGSFPCRVFPPPSRRAATGRSSASSARRRSRNSTCAAPSRSRRLRRTRWS